MKSLLVFCTDYSYPPSTSALLRRSCDRVGVPLQTYGQGQNWPGYGIGKIVDAAAYLQTRTEDACLYTDSQDSFLVYGADKILEAWERCGSPQVLLQAEKNCYPERDWWNEYPAVASPWRYICAGGWMGTRTGLIAALSEIAAGEQFAKDSYCDQRCWTDWYLRHPNAQLRAALDTNCEVFQSMAGTGELRDDGFNTKTATWPTVIHGNGRVPFIPELYQKITGDNYGMA